MLFVIHTKVFGEDGLVVFLLKGRESRVQDHLALSRQVQQHLGNTHTSLCSVVRMPYNGCTNLTATQTSK